MAAFFVGDRFVTRGPCVPLVFVIVGLGFVDFWNAKGEKYD
jgi:hypothetical protein